MVVYTLQQRFVKWACDRLAEAADLAKKSSFQMKLILILAGIYVNKIVSFEAFFLIFFLNEQGEAITVNGDRYRVMLNESLFTRI